MKLLLCAGRNCSRLVSGGVVLRVRLGESGSSYRAVLDTLEIHAILWLRCP